MRGIFAAIVFVLGALQLRSSGKTTLFCVPNEPRVAAPDRLVSVEVTVRQNGNFTSVVYRAANGASYDRGKQILCRKHFSRGKKLLDRHSSD